MNWRNRVVGIALGFAGAGFLVVATEADAGPANRGEVAGKARGRKPRKPKQFRSLPAPARSATPGTNDAGAPAQDAGPVAGAAAEGDFRQDVIDTGSLLTMAPGRALALNQYRGLHLIDTSDPAAPRILSTLRVTGNAQRMLLGSGNVVVVSDTYGRDGGHTLVTSVSTAGDTLVSEGSVSLDGSLRDAAREGDEITIVTGANWWGPYFVGPVYDVKDSGNVGPNMPGKRSAKRAGKRAFPNGAAFEPDARDDGSGTPPGGLGNDPSGIPTDDGGIPWTYDGSATVARLRVGADGTPSLLGSVNVTGSVMTHTLTGTDAVLAVYEYTFSDGAAGSDTGASDPMDPNGAFGPTITGYATKLVRVEDGTGGAPEVVGSADLGATQSVSVMDRDGESLRIVGYSNTGTVLETFDLSGAGAPVAQGSLTLTEYPSSWTFAGDAFAYTTVTYPAWDMERPQNEPKQTEEPTTTLHVVDLRDASAPAESSATDLGAGYTGQLLRAGNGVLAPLYTWSDMGTTKVVHADLTDPSAPSLSDSGTLDGWWYVSNVLGDLALLSGGEIDETGAYRPAVRLADLSDGLSVGGDVPVSTWVSTVARDGDLLGVGSYDRLTLIDVSDVGAPEKKGEVRLLVNAAGFAPLSDTTGAVLATDYVTGSIEIRSVSLPSADALSPIDVLEVGTGDAQMYPAGTMLYVVATDWATGRAKLHVVDASDASDLRLRGSLDLASYPGQVFLKGDALLLLRDAASLFTTNENGRIVAEKDPFGRGSRSWLRDELTAVLDVVDLRDPDAPKAGGRLRVRCDFAGQAILAGDSLYVPSYEDVSSQDPSNDGGYGEYAYFVREIDLADPLRPRAGKLTSVPGTLIAAANAPHQVLTASYEWDPFTGASTSSVNVVDLSRPFETRVLATRAVEGYIGTAVADGTRTYVTTESWGGYVIAEDGTVTYPPASQLLTLGLSDLAVRSESDRATGSYGAEIAGNCLFIRTWGWVGGLDVYSLADADAPSFTKATDVAGQMGRIHVIDGRAYIAGGLFGVESFDLAK